ncbi:MAG TPA: hypothetical protein VF916_03675, partial [Ktedonobacterales bacterium]
MKIFQRLLDVTERRQQQVSMSQQYAQPQMAFLVTIDMEGNNPWARRQQVTTRNAEYLPRFQHLCERHEMSPTSLTDWEVARSSAFREPAGDNIL